MNIRKIDSGLYVPTASTSQGSRRGAMAILALAFLGAVVTGLFASGTAQFYGVGNGAANAGFVVGDCYNFDMGIEVKGHPGFFVDVC